MMAIFQMIDKETGNRSEPFVCKPTKLLDILTSNEEVKGEDYILMLAHWDEEDPEESYQVAQAPLITVQAYREINNQVEWKEQANG